MDSLGTVKQRRQYLLALMFVAGLRTTEIAKRLGYSTAYTKKLTDSPLFREYAAEIQRDLKESTLGTLLDRIDREALPSLDVICDIRDGSFDDHNNANTQLKAATFILGDLHMDRKMPKVTKQENDGTLHVSFGPQHLRQMLGAVAEADGTPIDIEWVEGARLALPVPEQGTDAPKRAGTRPGGKPRMAKPTIVPITAHAVDELMDELRDEEEEFGGGGFRPSEF